MIRAVLIAAVILTPRLAAAQPAPALHDKAWYVAHPDARVATLHWCHSDSTYADMFDCQNAEAADALTIGKQHRTVDGYLNDPHYWAQNPISRGGAMLQCARRGPGDEMVLPYCNAIRAGDAMAKAGHN